MRPISMLFGVAFATAVAVGQSVAADKTSLNAVSFSDIPANTPVVVEIYDDSQETIALKKSFEQHLSASGYKIETGARLILTVETRDTSGKWTGGGSNRLIAIGNSENHTGTDAPDVRVSIFDSEKGGILNPKRNRGTSQVAPSEFRIDVTLEDRTNGKMLWQGWSIRNIGASYDLAVRQSMVKPLVANIGKTVRSEHPAPQ